MHKLYNKMILHYDKCKSENRGFYGVLGLYKAELFEHDEKTIIEIVGSVYNYILNKNQDDGKYFLKIINVKDINRYFKNITKNDSILVDIIKKKANKNILLKKNKNSSGFKVTKLKQLLNEAKKQTLIKTNVNVKGHIRDGNYVNNFSRLQDKAGKKQM